MNMKVVLALLLATLAHPMLTSAAAPKLKVSENKRFLVTAEGKPFFYLGDTAWELFHRLNREQADKYLEDRARKGFTVIQAVALAELNGLNDPNPYGHTPLLENDPAKPDLKDGPQNDYWDHVDYIVNKAEKLGLTIGFLPTWGDKWNPKWAKESKVIFTTENAEKYGQFVGARYKDKPIIWILGGDRPIESDEHKEIIRAMAKGLRAGDGGNHLMTFHPPGGNGSSQWFHEEDWLDFNMRQNGHVTEFGRYAQTKADYDKTPLKPVMDGEPIYEDHPISFNAKEFGHSVAARCPQAALLESFFRRFRPYLRASLRLADVFRRKESDQRPIAALGSGDQSTRRSADAIGRKLIESRPFLTRIPDDSVIVTDKVPTSVPGSGQKRLVATQDTDGTYAMVYSPVGRKFSVKMDVIKGAKVKAWWFDPRNGKAQEIGQFDNKGTLEFIPPNAGEMLDWVLVLDDAQKNYPAPGAKSLIQ